MDQKVYGSYCDARKRGHIVTLWGRSTDFTLTAGQYTDLTTLPETFRPSRGTVFPATSLGGSATILCQINNTTGVISLYTSTATSYWSYCITYVV